MESATRKRVITLLHEAEASIQKAIIETAKSGDYSTSRLTSEVAKELQQISSNLTESESKSVYSNPSDRFAGQVSRRTAAVPSKGKKPKKTKYPKFQIRNDSLIRIGWSKKEKNEYTHKASRSVFDQTVRGMVDISQSGDGPFMAEQIIEAIHDNNGDAVPSYQVYLVIGFLREFDCVKQIGREGYDILANLPQLAEDSWNELSS